MSDRQREEHPWRVRRHRRPLGGVSRFDSGELGKPKGVGSAQHERSNALTPEEARDWLDALRCIYDEGYLSVQKFDELRRGILARVERPRTGRAA